MHVVHGTWIPDAPRAFVQPGGFYLWVETEPPTRPPRRQARVRGSINPYFGLR